ncbi:MAG: SpoIIE family protein phosphatase [Flammeovirgaceae bacterium]|nr:SpoIIE family protein phosphatase [Flammeovirgaceae bacterium]MDW8286560.1 two-component regulator propeller domain-containing protein [Flammeovirgaceae bacterium]
MKIKQIQTIQWITYCLCYCYIQLVSAQNYDITRFSNRDGLAQTHCRSIEKDKLGRIWIGTNEGGISVYSGQEFQNYLAKNGLSHNFIYDIAQDNNGNLWIATGNGITCAKGMVFERYLTLDSSLYKVTRLAVAPEEVYFIDENNRIGILKKNITTFLESSIFLGKSFTALYYHQDSTLWVGTEKDGLILWKNNHAQQITMQQGLPSNEILSIHHGKENEILIGTANGACAYKDKKIQRHPYQATEGKKIFAIQVDSKHRYWFGTNDGVYLYIFDSYLKIDEKNGLTQNIFDLEVDDEGGVWFASDEGLLRFNGGTFSTYYTTHGLSGNFILDLEIDNQQQLWIASTKGLNLMTTKKEIITLKNLPPELNNSPELVAKDKKGNIYVAYQEFIFQYLPEKSTFKRIIGQKIPPIISSLNTQNGELLIGTQKGIYRVRDGEIEKFFIKGIVDSLPINCIKEGINGELWIGTDGQGLFKYANRTLRQASLKEGLPSNVINCIYIDASNNIWLGTSGSSLCKIPYGDLNRKPVAYEEVDFSSPNIYTLDADQEGNLWAGTDKGMNKIIILQNDFIKVEIYQEAEGFLPLEVTLNASVKDKDGNIWIGTVNGLVKINPSEEVFSDKAPLVLITDLKLFYESADWTDYAEGIDFQTGLPINLSLPHDQNHLLFRFIGVSMSIPSKIRYSWKLKGLDANWTPPSMRREAIYPNLPPGEYTFMVKAANARGLFSQQPTEFHFEIRKPFYYTRTFISLTVFSTLLLVYLIIRRRVAKIQATQEMLRKKVRERTEEIEIQKAQIEAQRLKQEQILAEIEHKNEALKRINRDMMSSISYAGRIQKAVFPSEEKFKKILPDSFVISIPKKAVRGDFFWLRQNQRYIYVALVDCTSTGVPAGFLSLIGHDYLSQIINETCTAPPSDILLTLHERMIIALHPEGQSEIEGEVNDGMDIALCRIDKKTNQLVFAGARRPLLVLKEGQVEMIKGSFSSIGISFNKVNLEFEDHLVELTPTTTLYLFSEGFPNQFDAQGKKYKIARFRDFVASISHLPMEEQKEKLLEEYHTFKGDAEQFDDIVVIGFRFHGTTQD